mgnify:CR=1 FL=1
MARLIVKSPYFKGGGAKPAGGYLRYIATRERVEILPDDRPPTKRQTQLIEKLTKDFPDTKTLLEYGDYAAHPTKFSASKFLTLAMEENWSKVQEIDGYAKYIATRPRAERLGEHGLFGDEDAVDLNAAMAEVNSCTGNIWTHIISLRREDAERLGFDHADAWRALLRAHRNDIAEAMHIPPEDFRWYAAFHDEGSHPHIHMMAWSKKPGQAYLNREGIRKIKSVLTNQIFQQELLHIYEDKSQSRDELVRETRSAMLALAQKMQNSACEHPEAEQMIWELALELGSVKGKKSYGYLPKDLKQKVDAIVCVAADGSAVMEVVKKANEAGIPFVFNDRGLTSTEDAKVDYGIGTDNYALAKQTAEWFVGYLRENNISGKAVVFIGDLGDANAIERNRGYQEVIAANSDIIEVVAEVPTEWNLEKALSGTINAFQANPDATIIFSPADYIFPSIRSGLQQLGMWKTRDEEGHIWFTSFDGDKEALDAVKDGYVESIGAQPILDTGAKSIEYAVALANGETFDDAYELGSGFVVNFENFDETAKNASGYYGVE